MSDAFWSVRDLLRDRTFLLSATVSLVAIIIVGSLLAYLLSQDKIVVTPITEISFVDAPQKFKSMAKPISELCQLAELGDSKSKVAAENGYIWSGFVISLDELCQKEDINKKYVVVIKTRARMIAGTANISHKTCDIIKTLSDDEAICAISDTRFNSESKEVFLKIP